MEELEEEEEENEGEEGVGESSSEQSSEGEGGGSSGSETDSEGSALGASGGENRERTRRKRKTLAKDIPAASELVAESDDSDARDHSPVSPPARADLTRVHPEPVMRSKFDVDDEDDDSEDQEPPPRPLYKKYSGYEARLGDSDVSDDSGGEVGRGSERKVICLYAHY